MSTESTFQAKLQSPQSNPLIRTPLPGARPQKISILEIAPAPTELLFYGKDSKIPAAFINFYFHWEDVGLFCRKSFI